MPHAVSLRNGIFSERKQSLSIITVEYPNPLPSPKPKTLFEVHPKPWHLGEENESKCDIIDANGNRVATINAGRICYDLHPHGIADAMCMAVNLIDFRH